MGMFGGIPLGGLGGARFDNSEAQGTLLASLVLFGLSVVTASSYPFIVPMITLFMHFCPDQFDRLRSMLNTKLAAVVAVVVLSMFLSFGLEDTTSDVVFGEPERHVNLDIDERNYRSRQQTMEGSVDGYDGTLTSSVWVDFFVSMFLMSIMFFVPMGWSYIHSFILRVLPEQQRESFRRWTESFRPAPSPRGSRPTSRSAIEKLDDIVIEEKHLITENSPTGIMCPVCLDAMKLGEKVKRLPCKHFFHPQCVLPWLEKHNSCPTCRHELETNDPAYEYERQARQRREETTRGATTPRPESSARSTGWTAPMPESSPREPGPTREQQSYYQRERERLLGLSVVELKAQARRQNISLIGCVEKRELVERILNRIV
eukprot:CAMPEP_0203771980 /NCGR_PEP_ID=MMETSP0099_2-20121227/3746_1 /ASSEMBLY_ACC=CAM_ASM_000209 /TAXON_ID=96639 /ORGANISM=" , Strain NY0313808BC1" /LENGTH=372 /DNA_ID=CAMNT_0050669445 /DNA_START=438 /DNA_END=1556 /DNA_ORIENTATION=-